MQALNSFSRAIAGRSRDAFVAEADCPFLVLSTALAARNADVGTGFGGPLTGSFGSGMAQPAVQEVGWVLPVRKRGGANSFAQMVTLGRADNNDLVLQDYRVSKFHCFFQEVDGIWYLSDAGSLNGTWLEETRVEGEPLVLQGGAAIRLASAIDLSFVDAGGLYDFLRRG